MRSEQALIVLVSLMLITGCGRGTKNELANKVDKLTTVEEVKKALGKPDSYDVMEVPIIGKTETLTYIASDGELKISVLNGKVMMKITGEK